ncbi:MAG: hypothetical protein JRF43_07875, partial [Deltaproteobacteria bacterium]|nr:hypothetical protein [Deltaproteobacteria bacterium]
LDRFCRIEGETPIRVNVCIIVATNLEKTIILRALEMTKGQRAKAAELLEIKLHTLRQKMSDYGIEFRRTGKEWNPNFC